MTKIQLRRDTAANWTTNNPTLLAGEVGFETDTNKHKIGDGTTAWTSLAYQGDVTLDTAQTISGFKRFTSGLYVENGFIKLSGITPIIENTEGCIFIGGDTTASYSSGINIGCSSNDNIRIGNSGTGSLEIGYKTSGGIKLGSYSSSSIYIGGYANNNIYIGATSSSSVTPSVSIGGTSTYKASVTINGYQSGHWSFPQNSTSTAITLTLGSSGSSYTATADGYFVLTILPSASGMLQMYHNGYGNCIKVDTSAYYQMSFPCAKGNAVYITHPGASASIFNFYPCTGEV